MTPSERRKKENEELLKRWRSGSNLSRCGIEDTWWPPRSIIKKDENALKLLFDEDDDGLRR